jgi:glucose-1-phosphate thymidylyltransferase
MLDHSSNHHSRLRPSVRPLVGLVPAAGKATRLHPLPFSKELYPIGYQWLGKPNSTHPKPVCVSLLEEMRTAGVTEAYIVLRDGKWDIPAYLADGDMLNMHLAYLMMGLPHGVPFTLDQAYPFVRHATIVFGFPDILFYPEDAFLKLLSTLEATNADIVLGLFPVSTPGQMDVVELDSKGQIRRIHIKPSESAFPYTWIIASWTPSFTAFLHEYVYEALKKNDMDMRSREVCFSDVINTAIEKDRHVDYVIFHDGGCLDIGIPENLVRAVRPASGGPWGAPDFGASCME